ncbi:MAG: hypothetical protein ACR2KT_10180 [Methylocella sp.]|nr:MAG: hypothetical protein DLM68_06380 [Hyphomicrobiales bacterium]
MPGIADDLAAPEVAGMAGRRLVVEDDGDAFRMGLRKDDPAGGPRAAIGLARSSWNTSEIGRSLKSQCLVRLAPAMR